MAQPIPFKVANRPIDAEELIPVERNSTSPNPYTALGSGMTGTVSGLEIGEILQVLSFLGKSGRLTATSRTAGGVIDLQYGKVIHAESNQNHRRLGRILITMGFINQQTFSEALFIQKKERPVRRIGEILISLGVITKTQVERAVRSQIFDAVEEIMRWRGGIFKFDTSEPTLREEIGLDALDLYLLEGMEVENILLQILVKKDNQQQSHHIEEVATLQSREKTGISVLQSCMLEEYRTPQLHRNLVHRVLTTATRYFDRAILFKNSQRRLTEIDRCGSFPAAETRRVRDKAFLPVDQDSIFSFTMKTLKPYYGPVQDGHWNRFLTYQLGGEAASEVAVLPAIANGDVEFILYCDNASSDSDVERTNALELLMNQIGGTLEAMTLNLGG